MLQFLKEGKCHGVIERSIHNEYLEGGSFKGSSMCEDLSDPSFRVKLTGEFTGRASWRVSG